MKFLLVAALALFAQHADAGDVKGKVQWQAVGTPGFLKINAEGGEFKGHVEAGKDGKVSGQFTCALAFFKTGIDLRDEHMRDRYLEVQKHPEAKLKLDPWTPTSGESEWTGTLTLKGVTRPVKGVANYVEGHLIASFVVNVSDYPIGVPSYLGVTMAKEVTVTVEGDVK